MPCVPTAPFGVQFAVLLPEPLGWVIMPFALAADDG
jgi:hypothetical protein